MLERGGFVVIDVQVPFQMLHLIDLLELEHTLTNDSPTCFK